MENGDREETKNSESDFGKVVKELHHEQKIPSLRTYQGDIAKFIKEKNESTISIALKEKAKKEEEHKLIPQNETREKAGFQINFTIIILSFALIVGGIFASLYIFNFLTTPKEPEKLIEVEIIPYNNLIHLTNVSKETISSEIEKISQKNGVTLIKISNEKGLSIATTEEFFKFVTVPDQRNITRVIKNDFILGTISNDESSARFIIFKVNDFGRAFSSMLEWEKDMLNDLKIFNKKTATTTSSEYLFNWRDAIIKNKDVRSLINEKGESQIAYTFLDKNTILIIDDIFMLDDIALSFSSRQVVR
jgi:hypothetical protein